MRFRTVPKTWLRDNLRAGLASLGDEGLVITQRGRAIAIVITAERWNRLQGDLDDLQAQARLNGQRSSREAFMAWLEEGDRKVGRPPSWG
jgi:PHD/YefM family antitoxin component YafN of YafNO toxin-antitoxin module